jgi:hypothetical protein
MPVACRQYEQAHLRRSSKDTAARFAHNHFLHTSSFLRRRSLNLLRHSSEVPAPRVTLVVRLAADRSQLDTARACTAAAACCSKGLALRQPARASVLYVVLQCGMSALRRSARVRAWSLTRRVLILQVAGCFQQPLRGRVRRLPGLRLVVLLKLHAQLENSFRASPARAGRLVQNDIRTSPGGSESSNVLCGQMRDMIVVRCRSPAQDTQSGSEGPYTAA